VQGNGQAMGKGTSGDVSAGIAEQLLDREQVVVVSTKLFQPMEVPDLSDQIG
jgi:hypothetical protein